MESDAEKVSVYSGVLCLSHVLFVVHFTSNQVDQVRAFAFDFVL